jgi:regulator of cell morphogenesis and NO signaling
MKTTNAPATIDLADTVNDVIARHPTTVRVFNDFGIDSCCGGAVPLITVITRHGLDPDALLVALRQAAP